jgi:DNA-directed RNA polymerase sigma subunit (sigma70/sigma32)
MTLEEISERLGLAITQIRAIEQTALTKLRNSKSREYFDI